MKNIVLFSTFTLLLFGCAETVETGSVGMETSWGRTTNTLYGEGTHFVGPSVDIVPISIRLQNMDEQDINCQSKDNVRVVVDVTVSFALERANAVKVYRAIGADYHNVIILPSVRSAVRDSVASIDALVVAQARTQLETGIADGVRRAVRQTLKNQHLPQTAIRIDSVQLRNTDLPESLRDSIESIQRQSNVARERQQALFTAQQEAERARVEAEGRNRVALLTAQGQAEVRRIDGESQAAFNRVMSSSLTPGLIELRRIAAYRDIISNEHTRLVIMGSGGGGGSSGPIVLQTPPQ